MSSILIKNAKFGKKNRKNYLRTAIWCLVALDLIVWLIILLPKEARHLEMYFLDVGQGDSSLIRFPGGAKILIDAGPDNGEVEKSLGNILPPNDRYIDLALITHPQLDHFGGFISLFRHYKIGAVLMSKHRSDKVSWKELEKAIQDQNLKIIEVAAGDIIKYGDSELTVLSPRNSDIAKDINDLCVVTLLKSEGIKSFFGCDISGKKEKELASRYDLNVDILKVSHHGSRFSSDAGFLREVSPAVSVIEVGEKNSYRHPTQDALSRLAAIGTQILRTDQDGIIKITVDEGKLKIYSRE